MDELNLTDIYRQLHPRTKLFTYESKTLKLKSRIDFFLVSTPISFDVLKAEIRTSIAPDHKSVFRGVEIKSEFKRGPGLWKFNNTLLEDENYKELIIFCEVITIENHSLYWKSWVERGIYFNQDIVNSNGNFLTLDEFQTKFQIKTNSLRYFQLIVAIRSDLKKKTKTHAAPKRDILEITTISTFPGKTNLDLSVMGCKNYYKLFNESCVIEPTGVKKWKDKFTNDFVDWSNKFLQIY